MSAEGSRSVLGKLGYTLVKTIYGWIVITPTGQRRQLDHKEIAAYTLGVNDEKERDSK